MFPQLEDLDPMNDVLFKYIFGSDDRKHITIDFLNAVLNREGENAIKSITFQNIEMTPELENEKFSRIDFFAIIDDNERINIEVQCMNHRNMVQRSLYYWAQVFLHNESIKEGQNYIELKPTIAINILNFKFLPLNQTCTAYSLCSEDNHLHRLTDAMKFYFIEMPKFVKKSFSEMTYFEKWLAFFSKKLTRIEKEEMAVNAPIIQDALKSVSDFRRDSVALRMYNNRKAAILDYNTDMISYRAEGEEKMYNLFSKLSKAGRTDDLAKILADESLLPKFYEEFGIE